MTATIAGSRENSVDTSADIWTSRTWPLAVILGGLPLWWVLGLVSLVPLALAIPMLLQLRRLPVVHLPRGAVWWALFLAWVALGLGVLWANAPGAVPGGGSSRLLVFGYRFSWYAACTIVALWIINAPRQVLTDRRILRLGGSVFVVCTFGGLLGLIAPGLEFRSALEWLLPSGLRKNSFVASLVHPSASEVQSILGNPAPRPSAPFAFSNSWGSALSISVVFFLAAIATTRRRTRVAGAALLVLAMVPVLYSLNRGLWLALAAGAVGIGVLWLVRGRASRVVVVVTVTTLAIGIGLLGPLTNIVHDRLNHQHSNDRRSQLLEATVRSVTTGSPIIGYGSTRNVQGSFASIAGAATPGCGACGVPPLGTQGQLWLVLFSQGWLGLAFFLIFVLLALSRCWRCRTTNETVCTFALAFFLIQFPVYDSLGWPFLLVAIAIGLMERERRLTRVLVETTPLSLAELGERARAALPLALVLGLVGAGGALVGESVHSRGYQSSVSIELAKAPVSLDQVLSDRALSDSAVSGSAVSGRGSLGGTSTTGDSLGGTALAGTALSNSVASGSSGSKSTPRITIDTEATLLLSQSTLEEASRISGRTAGSLRRATTVAAIPNTNVLTVSVSAATPTQAVKDSDAVGTAYLNTMGAYLRERKTRLVAALAAESRSLDVIGPEGQRARNHLATAIAELSVTSTSPGSVVRRSAPNPAPNHQVEAVSSGAALGLLAGVGIAYAGYRRRRSHQGRSNRLARP